jgi:hypothetical protein
MMDRQEFREQLVTEFDIKQAPDGTRLITLRGVVLGRLGENEEGRWELDIRAGWHRQRSQLESSEAEHAETWAAGEIADQMAIEHEAIERGVPWGKTPPPGKP